MSRIANGLARSAGRLAVLGDNSTTGRDDADIVLAKSV